MRKIDAERLDCVVYKGIPEGFDDRFDDGVMWMLEQIDKLPTVEPEIVRCKECKHQERFLSSYVCKWVAFEPTDEKHCCYAERRADEQN